VYRTTGWTESPEHFEIYRETPFDAPLGENLENSDGQKRNIKTGVKFANPPKRNQLQFILFDN
jgi:hypothetical protein